MGIPALVSTEMELTQDLDGKLAVVDGNHGTIYVDPDAETMEKMKTLKKEEEEKKELLQTFKNKESITLDGKRVLTYANIGNVKDLALVLQNGAEGIGLFRSEFLYLESETYPTEEEQFEVYEKSCWRLWQANVSSSVPWISVRTNRQIILNWQKRENPAMGCPCHPHLSDQTGNLQNTASCTVPCKRLWKHCNHVSDDHFFI